MKWILAFVLSFGFWVLLVWPLDWQEIFIGLFAALIAMILFGGMLRVKELKKLLNPLRYLWGLYYILALIYYIIKANLDVAYRVLHPKMPILPGIVKVRTTLKNDIARTILANSITLTPGTLSVDLSDDGHYYVHWINVRAQDVEGASERIVGRFERILRRVFE
ncbi:MAG: Na+/H+ antiporter subunit E [Candidatus Bipolaricaulia bacterium]